MVVVDRTVVFRWIRMLLAAAVLAVLASIADAILGHRVGSKAIAWALLGVTLLDLFSRLAAISRRTTALAGE